jgi:hypothetical protein
MADAGTGLERGVQWASAARSAEAQGQAGAAARPIAMGLDVCHTQRELQRVVQRKSKRAERP